MQKIVKYGFENTNDGKYILKGENPWWSFSKPAFWIIAAGVFGGMLLDADIALLNGSFHFAKYLEKWTEAVWVLPLILSPLFILIFLGVSQDIIIDFAAQNITIVRRRSWGKKRVSFSYPLGTIRVNALRIGVTDATPYGAWIVKAGFFFENETGEECDTAIWSKEVTKIEERNEIMFELYHFFFPNRPAVNEGNIITNGTAVMLLSDSEKEEFSKQEVLFEKKKDTDDTSGNSKWDRLL